MEEKFKEVWQSSSEEDKKVLEMLLESMSRKQAGSSRSYLGALLQAESRLIGDMEYEIKIPNTAIIQNSLNIVHGGITATILDTAMGTLVHHLIPDDKAAVTAEMKINYLSAGIGSELVCRAGIIHRGTKTVVTEGRVFRDDGKLIAHSTATFYIINRR